MIKRTSSIFKDDNYDNLLDRISSTISQIPQVHHNLNENKDDPTAKDAINEYIDSSLNKSPEILSLFNDSSVPADRLERYKIYDEIYKTIQIVKRVIKVYTNNIIQKDVITGKSITLKDKVTNIIDDEKQKSIKEFCNQLITHYGLEEKFKNKIVPSTLVYGDYFVELIDLNEGYLSDTIQVINESSNANLRNRNKKPYKTKFTCISEADINLKINNLKFNKSINIDNKLEDSFKLLTEYFVDFDSDTAKKSTITANKQSEKRAENVAYDFSSVKIKYHKPHTIVMLATPNDTIMGYLEVADETSKSNMPAQRFAALINQLGIASGDNNEKIIKRFANYVIQKALSEYNVLNKGENTEASEQAIIDSMGSDLYYSIKGLFFDINGTLKINPNRKIKVRFIPCSKMIHIMLPGHEYDPYGTSVNYCALIQ